MISRSIFHLFLSLSVIIILIGMVLVIFTQFDQGYVATDHQNLVNAKQSELIKEISQAVTHSTPDATAVKNEVRSDNNVLTLIEQVKTDDSAVDHEKSQTVTDQEINRINQLNQRDYRNPQPLPASPYSSNSYDDYQQNWLINNPWNPQYDPNKRY